MLNNTLPTPVALRAPECDHPLLRRLIFLFFDLSLSLLADCVYIESRRPNTPYFICSIQDFKLVSTFIFSLPTSCPHCLLLLFFLFFF